MHNLATSQTWLAERVRVVREAKRKHDQMQTAGKDNLLCLKEADQKDQKKLRPSKQYFVTEGLSDSNYLSRTHQRAPPAARAQLLADPTSVPLGAESLQ
jgi:hypothetical protein